MATTTSKVSQVGSNYYKTSVTENADGSLNSTTYRTDAQGNNPVEVYNVSNATATSSGTKTFGSGATAAEQTAFSNPNSAESKARSTQVQTLNPANATADQTAANKSAAGKQNEEKNPEEGDATSTLTPEQEKDIGTTAKETRDKFGTNLYYPINLKKEKQDILQIDMVKYSPTPLSSSTLSGFGTKPKEEIKGTVYLPIPTGISDSNGVSWQSDEINPLQAAGANFAKSAITGGAAAAGQTAQNLAGTAQGGIGALQTAIANAAAESAVGTQNLLSRTKGVVTNPNMELIFTGPQLRQFSFTYKLSSRSKKESEMIRSIIRFFKQGMAVQRTEAQLFLKAPFTFKLTYKHQNKDHIYLNKFKECALTNFSVDYTPEGQYATFTDGAMVSYQITMQFQELNPIFNDDYGNKENTFPDPDIGY